MLARQSNPTITCSYFNHELLPYIALDITQPFGNRGIEYMEWLGWAEGKGDDLLSIHPSTFGSAFITNF